MNLVASLDQFGALFPLLRSSQNCWISVNCMAQLHQLRISYISKTCSDQLNWKSKNSFKCPLKDPSGVPGLVTFSQRKAFYNFDTLKEFWLSNRCHISRDWNNIFVQDLSELLIIRNSSPLSEELNFHARLGSEITSHK